MSEDPRTKEYADQMERVFDLKREAVELLDLIAAEFKSDPMSVQCFDKRIVERTIAVSAELKQLDPYFHGVKIVRHDDGN